MTEQEFLDRLPEFLGTIGFYFDKRLGHPPNDQQMAAYLRFVRGGATGADIDATLAREPEAIAFAASGGKPQPQPSGPRGPAQPLVVRGTDFIDANGDRIVLCGTDQFPALRQVIDGVDLQPLIDESLGIGFDLWRVFSMGSKARNGVMDLRPQDTVSYNDAVVYLADTLNAHGIVLLICAYVDNQDVKAGDDHWRRLTDLLRGKVALPSGGNEWHQNGFDPGRLTDPGMLWSRGSDVGDAPPFTPIGSFVEFHPRRDLPKALLDSVASAVQIRDVWSERVPLIIDEPPRMGSNGSAPEYADPMECWRFFRHYATECAGVVFHSRAGTGGVLMDDVTRACALAARAGARI